MSITRVRYFIEVARTGSIREASERLNVAPSALSRQIRNIEEEVGSPLFERMARGVALTAAGEVYLRYARTVDLETDRVFSELEDLRGLKRGHVRIASVEGYVSSLLAGAVTEFHGMFPGVTLRLTVTSTDDVIAAVRDGDTDAGLSYNAEPDALVRFALRVPDPLLLMMSPRHPLAGRGQIAFTDVLELPLAAPQAGFGIRRLIDERCRELNLPFAPVLETNSIDAMRNFARSGAGVTLLPGLSVLQDEEAGTLVARPIGDEALRKASLDLSVLAGRRLPAAVAEFLTVLERHITTADRSFAVDRGRTAGAA